MDVAAEDMADLPPDPAAAPDRFSGATTLIRVSTAELPLLAQSLVEPGIPRSGDARFLVRRSHFVWIPAVWLAGLLVVGLSSLTATLKAWPDRADGDARVIYGAMAATCLVGAAFSARKLSLGLIERRDVLLDRYRQGLHVLGLEGLLVAGPDVHTWVPRALLPDPIVVTSSSGGAGAKSYRYVLTDDCGRVAHLDCGVLTESALRMWSKQGQLPDSPDWR